MSYLRSIRACTSGQEWADAQADYRVAWDTCGRGDWMLWISEKKNVDKRQMVGASAECAGLVEHLMTDPRSINALRVAEMYAMGEATADELLIAAIAANDVTPNTNANGVAATAAAWAAAGLGAALMAANAAGASGGVRDKTLKRCADIVRKWIDFNDLKIEVMDSKQ